MRRISVALLLLTMAGTVRAGDQTFNRLMEDSDRAKVIQGAIKDLKRYFKADADITSGKAKNARTRQNLFRARNAALEKFHAWLNDTPNSLGEDLRGHPYAVIEILDRARVDYLVRPKAGIQYFKGNAAGISRGAFEYSVLTPPKYKRENDERYPLVVSLHGRVINPKHPAFRGAAFQQRSREVIYNNWLKTPGAEQAVILAPTGNPNGFRFGKDSSEDRQFLFRAVGIAMTEYRVDWNRIFVELHGSAMRAACQDTFAFAGFIVREREDDRKSPVMRPEEFYLFENLNGTPLCYIGDEANWDRVAKPVVEALQKAYEKVGKPENLLILKGKRDRNSALNADDAEIAKFLAKHRRTSAQKAFHWRYANEMTMAPMPVVIQRCIYPAASAGPLDKTAGTVDFKITAGNYKNEAGEERPFNKIEIQITEAEEIHISLDDTLVNLDHPVTVEINGKVVIDKEKVTRDWRFFFDQILPRRFFFFPYVAGLNVEFELKPQIEQEKTPPETLPEETPPEKPPENPPPDAGNDGGAAKQPGGN